METANLIKEMLATGEAIGTVKKIYMYDEDTIYIEGVTEEKRNFKLDLRIEEEKENA